MFPGPCLWGNDGVRRRLWYQVVSKFVTAMGSGIGPVQGVGDGWLGSWSGVRLVRSSAAAQMVYDDPAQKSPEDHHREAGEARHL